MHELKTGLDGVKFATFLDVSGTFLSLFRFAMTSILHSTIG